MNPFTSLSDDNSDQIRKYLRFFRTKKEGYLRALQLEINDIKSERLNEDMYTKEDLNEFTDFLISAIRSQMSGDFSSLINMSALALNQLLERAQDKGFDLELETATLENQGLLEAIEKMSLEPTARKARPNTLTSFRDEAKMMRDQAAQLEDTNSRLQAEISSLRQRLSLAERQSQHISESKEASEYSNRAQSKELERALEEAKEENSKRVAETTQFQQMRKMMQSQSSKIRDLRKRLQRYEPDAVKEDDDDC